MCVCTFTDPADVLHVEEITSTAKFGCKMVVVDGGDSEEVPTLISGSEPSATDDEPGCLPGRAGTLPTNLRQGHEGCRRPGAVPIPMWKVSLRHQES